jgi:hypothetical protein
MRQHNGKLILEKHWLLLTIIHVLIYAFQQFFYSFAAASPQLTYQNYKFSDFNKERTKSQKMIWIMIKTCWSVFKCFIINILD